MATLETHDKSDQNLECRESEHFNRRLALQLSAVTGCWLGANWIALQCIETYEFREACHRYHVSPQIAGKFQTRTIKLDSKQFPGRDHVDYKLLPPKNLQGGKKYPVLLYLHGAGERGSDGVQQLRSVPSWLSVDAYREKYPCHLIAPQCPSHLHWNYRGSNAPRRTDELDIIHSILCDVLKLPSADSKRVYIVGYSMGGYGTWEFACRYPELVTAIVPVAGAGDPAEAEKLRNVPLWAIHGADDHIVPVDGSDKMIEAIRETGGVPLYSRLKNVGHDALVPVRQNSQPILHWLFRQNSQRRSLAPAASRLPSTSP